MEWRDLEVWRRQRSYVGEELRKDAPDHVARLGLATSFVFVVGMAEGARVSALKGDLKFPIRYAVYNTIPSFVGGKVSASSVAAAMASPPPLRACTRATAHAANLRALRTAVAGYTVLSIVFQMALAGGKGTEAYERAVVEGCEVPEMSTADFGGRIGSAGGVVRLCGARGLEPALVAAAAARGRYRMSILPVVISGGVRGHQPHAPGDGVWTGRASSPLPAGALSTVLKRSPRPSYYRIDRDRLFCHDAWQPVAAGIAESGGSWTGRDVMLVLEADSLSSAVPQTLLSSPARSAAVAGACKDDCADGADGRMGEDQAVWGLSMLRRTLEEKRELDSGRIASVVLAERRLAGVELSTMVCINARAALLLSLLSWAQQCAADSVANNLEESQRPSASQSACDETSACAAETSDDAKVPTGDDATGSATRETQLAEEGAGDAEGNGTLPDDGSALSAPADTAAKILGGLEHIGRGVRVAVAPFGQLRSAISHPLGAILAWVKHKGRRVGLSGTRAAASSSQVLVYDTDDDDSFHWLVAQMRLAGWEVKRRKGPGQLPKETAASKVPVIVHYCNDERTLTAAAGHLAQGAEGPPVCAVVHSWDCGVQARHLLVERQGDGSGNMTEVICTSEVGEDLFQFVRWQLLSGATAEQVQQGLDDLFGPFHEVGAG